jgi:quercetin dioxygenase-like cupin family protein
MAAESYSGNCCIALGESSSVPSKRPVPGPDRPDGASLPLDEDHGADAVVVFDVIVPPKARVLQPRSHEACDEMVHGLSGTMTTPLGGVAHQVRAGEVVFVPRGKLHLHANLHDEMAHVLITIVPGKTGRRRFAEMGEVPACPGSPAMAELKALR